MIIMSRRSHRLPRDALSREVLADHHSNLNADAALVKASRILEKNFVHKGDPV